MDLFFFIVFSGALNLLGQAFLTKKLKAKGLPRAHWVFTFTLILTGPLALSMSRSLIHDHFQKTFESLATTYAATIKKSDIKDLQAVGLTNNRTNLIESRKAWYASHSAISNIFILEKKPDGGVVTRMDPKTDYNHSASSALDQAFTGQVSAYKSRTLGEAQRNRISVYAPIRAAEPNEKWILGMDFVSEEYDFQMYLIGLLVLFLQCVIFAISFVVVMAVGVTTHYLQRNLELRKERQKTIIFQRSGLHVISPE